MITEDGMVKAKLSYSLGALWHIFNWLDGAVFWGFVLCFLNHLKTSGKKTIVLKVL